MSRERVHEVSSPISLFPFIGILLCTMGALLVVLVVVSHSARGSAQREVQSAHEKAAAGENGLKAKMADVEKFVGNLNTVRSEAERKLSDEHQHLANVEDHIRRMQEKMRSLQAAAVELEALKKEHYDDRAQAEKEAERLNQLIDEQRKSLASLQDAADKSPGSYAVVPYEGPNGTYRRPMYIECVKDGVILQPEGVHLPSEDLRPPYGPGNPLAATLRATRDQIIRLYPKEGQSHNTEPYPLLLVRSEGLINFDRARQAIEGGDFDLGFELVEDDWKLKFPQPDPQLASIQQQALAQARARQAVLMAAAPRAYGGGGGGSDGEFGGGSSSDSDDGDSGGYADGGSSGGGGGFGSGGTGVGGGGGSGGSSGNGSGGGSSMAGSGSGAGSGMPGSGGSGGSGSPSGAFSGGGGGGGGNGGSGQFAGGEMGSGSGSPAGSGAAGSPIGGATSGGGGDSYSSSGAAGGPSQQVDGDALAGSSPGGPGGMPGGGAPGMSGGGAGGAAGGGAGGSAMGGSGSPMAMTDPNAPPDANQGGGVSMMMGSPPPDASQSMHEKSRHSLAEARGKDWALKQKPQRATPVRRTIRVFVRDDQLTILPDDAPATPNALGGKVIPMKGDTVESLDPFVKEVRDEIDGWGMAGTGLYWRPVILLSVSPQGQRRASDLERLLKNSGLDIRTDETANNAPARKVQ